MKRMQIIKLVNGLKKEWKTNDPYEIAERFGIKVIFRNFNVKYFKGQVLKMTNYPTIISINGAYSEVSKKVLCAHELGHALLHENLVNHFDITPQNISTDVEFEANLFAVALLFEEEQFNIPFSKMSNAIVKSILDYNLYTQ